MRIFVTTTDINDLQQQIMVCVDEWARQQKTPITRKTIIVSMKQRGHKSFTTINAINSLIRKGYLRRAIGTSNVSKYVQLKGI